MFHRALSAYDARALAAARSLSPDADFVDLLRSDAELATALPATSPRPAQAQQAQQVRL